MQPEIFQDVFNRWVVALPMGLNQPSHRVIHAKSEAEARLIASLWPQAIAQKRRLLRNPWRLSSKTKKQEWRRKMLQAARKHVLDAARLLVEMEQR